MVSVTNNLLSRIAAATQRDVWFQDPKNTRSLLSNPGGFFQKEEGEAQLKLVLPNDPTLKREIIASCHSAPLAGHPGRDRTVELVSRNFWWPTLRVDVEDFVASCDSCQRNKPATGKPAGLLKPLSIPEGPWESVSMDFIMGLPKTRRGYDAVAVFVDRLTKMAHIAPCRKDITAEQSADLFFDTVVRLHGLPKTIITDRDSRFTGAFMPALLKRLGAKQNLSTAFHPQSDGQTERMNRVLGDMLRNYSDYDPSHWDRYLSAAEFAINNSMNRSTGATPFYLNYGFHPRVPLHLELGDTVPAAKRWAETLADRLAVAKRCLTSAQDRQKADADKRRKNVTFEPGQMVLVSTRNLSLVKGSRKLMPKWIGPFPIEAMVNDVAARLTLPSHYRFHNVFHVSLLRPYRTDTSKEPVNPPPPLEFDNADRPVWRVERILDHETRKLRTRSFTRFLVKWEGYGHEHDTWVEEKDFSDPHAINAYWAAYPERREDAGA